MGRKIVPTTGVVLVVILATVLAVPVAQAVAGRSQAPAANSAVLPGGATTPPVPLAVDPAKLVQPADKVVGNISLESAVGGCPMYDLVDPANGEIYVTQGSCDFNVSVIDGATNSLLPNVTITQLWLGAAPTGLALDSANGHLFVADGGDGGPGVTTGQNVSVVDTASNLVVATVTVGQEPWELAYDSANGDVYVTNVLSNNVSVISGSTNAVIKTINVGNTPGGVTYDSSNGDLYVANDISNNLTVIDGATNTVVASIPVGQGPQDPVYDSANGYIYTTSYYNDNVSVVNGATNKVVGAITVGKEPIGIGFDSSNGYVYVANWNGGSVTVIDGATDHVVGTDIVQSQPRGVAYDAVNGYVYVVNYINNTVSYILPSTSSTGYPLASVSVNPPSATVHVTSTASFSAIPTCTGGTCPAGTSYSWTQTHPSMGTLSSTSGASISFTAGAVGGSDALFVNATLNGVTKMSAPVPVTITTSALPELSSVGVSPSPASVSANGSLSFSTTLTCTGGACPTGSSYLWSLTNRALGTLNSSAGASVNFTAGPTTGTLRIFVNVTLNGVTREGNATITITAQTSGGGQNSGLLGLPGSEGYLLIGGIAAAAAAGTAVFLLRRPRVGTPATPSPPPGAQAWQQSHPPPPPPPPPSDGSPPMGWPPPPPPPP